MKRVDVDFRSLGRRYVWSYAKQDTSVIDWLLHISRTYDVQIIIQEGFAASEVDQLISNNCFKLSPPALVAYYQGDPKIKDEAA